MISRDFTSENYFTYAGRAGSFQGPRFNYTAAVFSTSGFTQGAVEYAVAHQVFLIQYENIPAIQPLIDAILSFDEDCINLRSERTIAAARTFYRQCLAGTQEIEAAELTDRGKERLRGPIARTCAEIRGSYFGMLQGQWPLHLLRREPLPADAFHRDEVRCRVHGNERGEWMFVPVEKQPGEHGWFELEFSLPPMIAELVRAHWGDRVAVANIKQQYFSYIDLSGVIGGIRRSVRLELHRDWINSYIQRRQQA